MQTTCNKTDVCLACCHPESDHVHGHCNGLADRTRTLGDGAAAVPSEDLCNCVRFISPEQHAPVPFRG